MPAPDMPADVRRVVEATAAAYCEERVSPEVRDRLRVAFAVDGDALTIFEERPRFRQPKAAWTRTPIARFRFDDECWWIEYSDRNGVFRPYGESLRVASLDEALAVLDEDAFGAFWG